MEIRTASFEKMADKRSDALTNIRNHAGSLMNVIRMAFTLVGKDCGPHAAKAGLVLSAALLNTRVAKLSGSS
ncbi:hypothetical protein [Pantoea sp. S62]|uniref:hypothetical protein n=1 Tax=Pantoea sp. S62 TaxID=2769342 RepID=UPI001914ADEC|nr:hypothetical protein [Pantoea sp. S62]